MSRALPRAVPLFALLVLAGCVSALRKPPTVDELVGGAAPAEETEVLLARAETLYESRTLDAVREAVETWLQAAAGDQESTAGLIGAARAATWLAMNEPTENDRERIARRAVQSAQLCLGRAPEDPECSYWLAVGLGVQARSRPTTAFDALPRIVKLLRQVAEDRPELERGGPHRVLALVFLRAPGWPRGPGDPDAGLEAARQAVALDALYAPNQLCLAEALAAVDLLEESREVYRLALELAQEAARRGDPEASEWLAQAAEALGESREG